MIEPTGQHDQNFVTQFLREIGDIEDINQRFQLNIQEKSLETSQKYSEAKINNINDTIDITINMNKTPHYQQEF